MDEIIGYAEEPIRPPAPTQWVPPKGHCEACGLTIVEPATCHVPDHRAKVCAACDRDFAHVWPQRTGEGS